MHQQWTKESSAVQNSQFKNNRLKNSQEEKSVYIASSYKENLNAIIIIMNMSEWLYVTNDDVDEEKNMTYTSV